MKANKETKKENEMTNVRTVKFDIQGRNIVLILDVKEEKKMHSSAIDQTWISNICVNGVENKTVGQHEFSKSLRRIKESLEAQGESQKYEDAINQGIIDSNYTGLREDFDAWNIEHF